MGNSKRLFDLLLVAVLFLCSQKTLAQTNWDVSKWEPEIKAFEKSDRANPPPKGAILFLGSSSFRKWTALTNDIPGKQIINRGFGGSEIPDSIALADRIVFPYEPRMIVFYAGDNDLAAGRSPDQVAADYKTFVEKVHARLPKTTIAFLAIKPSPLRWKLRDQTVEANEKIKGMKAEYLKFIDIYPLMLGADGKPKREYYLLDGLHPTEACYKMWAGVITPYLD